jgi:hypothetical protein
MNIKAALEKEHSKIQAGKITKFIGADAKRFAELMRLFFEGEYRVIQRAAWPMSNCVKNHPSLIKPYFKKIVGLLKRTDLHPAVERNIMRLLQYVEIPKRWQGDIMNHCFESIADPKAAIAVKAFSLRVLEIFLKTYPGIFPEIKLIIEERWDKETPAFRSRAKQVLKTAARQKLQ